MKASILLTANIICPGVRSVSMKVPSEEVTAVTGPSSLMALTLTPSTPTPLRTTRPVISTPASSFTSTGRDVAAGAHDFILAIALHRHDDAPHSAETAACRFCRGDANAGNRPSVRVEHFAAEGDASWNRDRHAALFLARTETHRCAVRGRKAFLRGVDLEVGFGEHVVQDESAI